METTLATFKAGERTAAASVVAIVMGLVLPNAAAHSFDRSVLVWLSFSVLLGILLGTGKVVPKAALVSALCFLTFIGTLVAKMMISVMKNPTAPIFESATFRASGADIPLVFVLGFFVVLVMASFLVTMLVVSLSAIGKRPLVHWLAQLQKAGPDGIDKINKTLIALVGCIAALVTVWAAVGD